MKTFLKAAALAALPIMGTISAPTAVHAQAAQTAILVVDLERISADSAAGKNGQSQLQAKAQTVQARVKTLSDQIGAEYQALDKARASMAQEAFQAKAKDLETRRGNAENEVRGRQQDLAQAADFVRRQILEAVDPIIKAIMRERGAQMVLVQDATMAYVPSVDVTEEVIKRLNVSLPTVSITPPTVPAASNAPAQPAPKKK